MARNPEEAQRLVIPLKPEETLAFLGQADKNLKKLRALLREAFPERLKLVVRGDQVELSGDPEAVGVADQDAFTAACDQALLLPARKDPAGGVQGRTGHAGQALARERQVDQHTVRVRRRTFRG